MDEITYKVLSGEEWEKLIDFYPEGYAIPDPTTSGVVVAEKDGKIVGALFGQLVLHMEPLIITDPQVSFIRLLKLAEAQLPPGSGYYAFAADAKIGRMAEIAGMKECSGWRIYVK